jgi:carboxylate-amine ligase
VTTKALTRRLLERLEPHAQDLGSADALRGIRDLLERGNGASRQIVVYEANHDLNEVMAEIVAATAA